MLLRNIKSSLFCLFIHFTINKNNAFTLDDNFTTYIIHGSSVQPNIRLDSEGDVLSTTSAQSSYDVAIESFPILPFSSLEATMVWPLITSQKLSSQNMLSSMKWPSQSMLSRKEGPSERLSPFLPSTVLKEEVKSSEMQRLNSRSLHTESLLRTPIMTRFPSLPSWKPTSSYSTSAQSLHQISSMEHIPFRLNSTVPLDSLLKSQDTSESNSASQLISSLRSPETESYSSTSVKERIPSSHRSQYRTVMTTRVILSPSITPSVVTSLSPTKGISPIISSKEQMLSSNRIHTSSVKSQISTSSSLLSLLSSSAITKSSSFSSSYKKFTSTSKASHPTESQTTTYFMSKSVPITTLSVSLSTSVLFSPSTIGKKSSIVSSSTKKFMSSAKASHVTESKMTTFFTSTSPSIQSSSLTRLKSSLTTRTISSHSTKTKRSTQTRHTTMKSKLPYVSSSQVIPISSKQIISSTGATTHSVTRTTLHFSISTQILSSSSIFVAIPHDGKISFKTKFGIIAGCIVFVCVACVIFIVFLYRTKKARKTKHTREETFVIKMEPAQSLPSSPDFPDSSSTIALMTLGSIEKGKKKSFKKKMKSTFRQSRVPNLYSDWNKEGDEAEITEDKIDAGNDNKGYESKDEKLCQLYESSSTLGQSLDDTDQNDGKNSNGGNTDKRYVTVKCIEDKASDAPLTSFYGNKASVKNKNSDDVDLFSPGNRKLPVKKSHSPPPTTKNTRAFSNLVYESFGKKETSEERDRSSSNILYAPVSYVSTDPKLTASSDNALYGTSSDVAADEKIDDLNENIYSSENALYGNNNNNEEYIEENNYACPDALVTPSEPEPPSDYTYMFSPVQSTTGENHLYSSAGSLMKEDNPLYE